MKLKEDKIIYCKVCGAGWYVNGWGEDRAVQYARECEEKHNQDGNADHIAALTFFMSGGGHGYIKIIKSLEDRK